MLRIIYIFASYINLPQSDVMQRSVCLYIQPTATWNSTTAHTEFTDVFLLQNDYVTLYTYCLSCHPCTWNGSLGYIKKLFMFANNELWSTLKKSWYLIWRNFPGTVGNNVECSNTDVTFACVQLNAWTCSFIPEVKANRFDIRLLRLKTDESWYYIWSYTQFRKAFLAIWGLG